MYRYIQKLGPVAAAAATVALIAPGISSAQATRTWVSGYGDDANPCSRTAPCHTFAGAIAKTAAGGEIDALDPGDFGGVSITKAITIRTDGPTAGLIASGTSAITVDAGTGDTVTLKGLDFSGSGGTGLSGIKIVQAKAVHLEGDEVSNFENGIDVVPNAPVSITIDHSFIHDNTYAGILVEPNGGAVKLTVDDSQIDSNTCGLSVSALFAETNDCLNADAGPVGSAVRADVANTDISQNTDAGVEVDGSQGTAELANDLIDANGVGVRAESGAQLIEFGADAVFGNTTDGTPTQTIHGNVRTAVLRRSAGAAGAVGLSASAG